jgi:hypothetical protein
LIIDAPSILELRPTRVEFPPEALKAARIIERLEAACGGHVHSRPYEPNRNPNIFLLNGDVI